MLMISKNKQAGFSMIELLITILVFAIGMLGIASLQTAGMRLTRDAELTGQASVLASSMADRMRGNITFTSTYSDVDGTDRTCLDEGSDTPEPTCSVAQEEMIKWNEEIASVLPEGSGSVTNNLSTYTITITWTESQDSTQSDGQRSYDLVVVL